MARLNDRDREQQERQERIRRANNYQERVWRDHAIATGRYKGDKIPLAVMLAMRKARSAHLLREDLSDFDPSSRLGDPVATFPYKGKHRGEADGELMWWVHACGSVTIGDADPDF